MKSDRRRLGSAQSAETENLAHTHAVERDAFERHSTAMLEDARERAGADVNLEFAHQWAMIYHTTPPAEREAAKHALRRAQSARFAVHQSNLTEIVKAQRAAARWLLQTKHTEQQAQLRRRHEAERRRLNPRQGIADLAPAAAAQLLLRIHDTRSRRAALLPLVFRMAGLQATGFRHIFARRRPKPPAHDR